MARRKKGTLTTARRKPAGETVHLYPTGQAFVHSHPTAEIDVDQATADELLAYSPAVYSTEPTGWPPPATDPQPAAGPAEDAGPSAESQE